MFRGNHPINLDAKGRFAIPSRYRAALMEMCGGDMVITRDLLDPCLALYPMPKWREIEARLATLSSTKPVNRAIRSLLVNNANEVSMDKNGRILIPSQLRQELGLEQQLILLGETASFRIWNESDWKAQQQDARALLQAEIEAGHELPELPL